MCGEKQAPCGQQLAHSAWGVVCPTLAQQRLQPCACLSVKVHSRAWAGSSAAPGWTRAARRMQLRRPLLSTGAGPPAAWPPAWPWPCRGTAARAGAASAPPGCCAPWPAARAAPPPCCWPAARPRGQPQHPARGRQGWGRPDLCVRALGQGLPQAALDGAHAQANLAGLRADHLHSSRPSAPGRSGCAGRPHHCAAAPPHLGVRVLVAEVDAQEVLAGVQFLGHSRWPADATQAAE